MCGCARREAPRQGAAGLMPHNWTLHPPNAGRREFHRPFRAGGRPLCLRHSPASAAPRALLRSSSAFAGERHSRYTAQVFRAVVQRQRPTAPRHRLKFESTRAFPRVPRTPELVSLEAKPPAANRRCSRSTALWPESPSGTAEARNFTVDFQRWLTRRSEGSPRKLDGHRGQQVPAQSDECRQKRWEQGRRTSE